MLCSAAHSFPYFTKFQVWRPKWFILRRKSSQGQHRLECHKSEEACLRGRHKTIITLQTLVRIETAISRTHSHVFKLIFEDTALFLSTENETDLKEWMQLIKKLMFPGPRTSSSLHTASPEGKFKKFVGFVLQFNRYSV